MSTTKTENINVILGRIRTQAERIVERHATTGADNIESMYDGERILELIELANATVLQNQLTESLKGRK